METKVLDVNRLIGLVQEVNSENGMLEHLAVYEMSDFDEFNNGLTPTELANRIHFGDFNANDDYWAYDGYANFESFNEYEYEDNIVGYEMEIIEEAENLDLLDEEELELVRTYENE